VGKREVKRVTVPGRDGALGVERGTPSIVTELKAGVVRVDFMDGAVEEYFVPGGFAFKHANNSCDVSAPEGVKLDQVDTDALRAAAAEATKELAAAPAGSKAAASV
jgi:F0F1-type ATP synthase epsilon subunit